MKGSLCRQVSGGSIFKHTLLAMKAYSSDLGIKEYTSSMKRRQVTASEKSFRWCTGVGARLTNM